MVAAGTVTLRTCKPTPPPLRRPTGGGTGSATAGVGPCLSTADGRRLGRLTGRPARQDADSTTGQLPSLQPGPGSPVQYLLRWHSMLEHHIKALRLSTSIKHYA